ncbi:unnamed protein product, partial [Rotaria sp. Silwood1]
DDNDDDNNKNNNNEKNPNIINQDQYKHFKDEQQLNEHFTQKENNLNTLRQNFKSVQHISTNIKNEDDSSNLAQSYPYKSNSSILLPRKADELVAVVEKLN